LRAVQTKSVTDALFLVLKAAVGQVRRAFESENGESRCDETIGRDAQTALMGNRVASRTIEGHLKRIPEARDNRKDK
jgi:hypothetical protein